MTILCAHEAGHYLFRKARDANISAVFHPIPTIIGTMGAVIKHRVHTGRKALFDGEYQVCDRASGISDLTIIGLLQPPVEISSESRYCSGYTASFRIIMNFHPEFKYIYASYAFAGMGRDAYHRN